MPAPCSTAFVATSLAAYTRSSPASAPRPLAATAEVRSRRSDARVSASKAHRRAPGGAAGPTAPGRPRTTSTGSRCAALATGWSRSADARQLGVGGEEGGGHRAVERCRRERERREAIGAQQRRGQPAQRLVERGLEAQPVGVRQAEPELLLGDEEDRSPRRAAPATAVAIRAASWKASERAGRVWSRNTTAASCSSVRPSRRTSLTWASSATMIDSPARAACARTGTSAAPSIAGSS